MLDASEIWDPFDDRGELAARKRELFDALSPDAQARARWIERLNSPFVETQRYQQLNKSFDGLLDNANASLIGASSDVRLVLLAGASGSGKTTLLLKCLMDRPDLRPYRRPDGGRAVPALCLRAPKKTTPKNLLVKAINRYGVSVVRSSGEEDLFDQLRELAQEFRTRVCVVDEMQQSLRGTGLTTVENMQDTVRAMVDDDRWPFHAVFAGLARLVKFRNVEPQIARRSTVVELEPVNKASVEIMTKIIRNVIETDAGFTAERPIYAPIFVERIMHSASSEFGNTIQVSREACTAAFRRGSRNVTVGDFATVYAAMTGCRAENNVFLAGDWRLLPTPAETAAAEAEEMEKRR